MRQRLDKQGFFAVDVICKDMCRACSIFIQPQQVPRPDCSSLCVLWSTVRTTGSPVEAWGNGVLLLLLHI